MLSVEKLELYYGDARALAEVSLEVAAGEIAVIVGANGAGKSSLLRAISGLEALRSGRVIYRDRDLTGADPRAVCELGIGHVAEGRQIFPSLTVEDNLELGALLPRARKHRQATLAEVYALFP